MVQVGTVRLERVGLAAQTSHHHAEHIETRYHEHTESGHQWCTVYRMVSHTGIHTVLDGQQAQDETECQTTGIAHENLMLLLCIAEYIVTEEWNQDTYTDKGQEAIHPQSFNRKGNTEHHQGYRTQTGSQTVDTVDQVDGIGHKHHEQYRKGHTDETRDFSNAEEAIEIVDIQTGCRNQEGRHNLYQELAAVAYTYQVIADTHHIEQGQACHQGQHLRNNIGAEETFAIRTAKQEETCHKHTKHNHREKAHTTQTRDGTVVHFTFIGKVEEILVESHHKDTGNE